MLNTLKVKILCETICGEFDDWVRNLHFIKPHAVCKPVNKRYIQQQLEMLPHMSKGMLAKEQHKGKDNK